MFLLWKGYFQSELLVLGRARCWRNAKMPPTLAVLGRCSFPTSIVGICVCVCLHVCVCEPHSVSKSMYETFVILCLCFSVWVTVSWFFLGGGGARSSSKNSCWNKEAGGSSRVMQRPKSAMNEATLEPLVKNSRINCAHLLTSVSTVAQAFILRCFSNLTSNQPYQVLFRIDLKPGVNQLSFFWFCAATTLDRV